MAGAFRKLLILTMAISVLAACGKSKDGNPELPAPAPAPVPEPPPVGDGTGEDTGGWEPDGGHTVTFYPDLAEYNTFVAVAPLNHPTNFKITVDLQNSGTSNRYGGDVILSYVDNGQQRKGTLSAETEKVENVHSLNDNGKWDAHYNFWHTIAGKTVYSGFYEDDLGAIVLILDEMTDEGDASGGTLWSGKVYYKNFATAYAPKSPYRSCWFIQNDHKNYDCRADSIINKSSTMPGNGYRLLGTFRGLDPSKAFH